ncbi:site-specific integrase [Methanosarcina horonobensis]|nr:site-specific integrase [Methanosarcina horonobensis]
MARNYLERRKEYLKEFFFDPETGEPTGKPESIYEKIYEYLNHRENIGKSEYTRTNDVMALTEFCKNINKPIDKLTKVDIYQLFDSLKKGKSKSTIQFHKIGIRLFLDFAGRTDLAELCKFERSKTDEKLPEDILTSDDVEKLINAASSLRDRALIAFMYESGARRGEFFEIQIKHVVFDKNGAVVTLPKGKTGARRIRLVWSSGYLRNWIDNHPLRENRDAYVWCSSRDYTKTLEYVTFQNSLKRFALKAGVQKRVNMHSFRHAAATRLANDLTEQQLKKYLGWSAGSDMAARYVHLSGKDIDQAILKVNGIEIEEEDKTELKTIRCPRCNEIQNDQEFCFKCGMPLHEKPYLDTDTELEKFKKRIEYEVKMNTEILPNQMEIKDLQYRIQEIEEIIQLGEPDRRIEHQDERIPLRKFEIQKYRERIQHLEGEIRRIEFEIEQTKDYYLQQINELKNS